MSYFVWVLVATIILSFLPEFFLKPNKSKLTINNIFLQSLLITLAFLVLTLIVQRPIFSGLAILVFLVILIAVSNAKFKALKEPMVFSDIAMFAQAFKHPRLYFPFLGLAPVVVAPLLIGGLIYAVLTFEPAMPFTWPRVPLTFFGIVLAYYLSKKFALTLNLSKNPELDNVQFGLQNTLFAYLVQSQTNAHKDFISNTLKASPFNTKDHVKSSSAERSRSTPPPFSPFFLESKPNITVIQSESFFDARRLHPSIRADILKNFDAANDESLQYGKLKVPAWGANTMRTEFSFLTGLKFEDMGFYRYYPYQFLSDFSVASIALLLKAQGYHCVCIHPHPASFFGRDKLFPKMGFDEFIDIKQFQNPEKFGPYISDQTVTDKILAITEKNVNKPLFIFVITMENHGPLHLEKTSKDEYPSYYKNHLESSEHNLPKSKNDLTVYLRHLKNADKMIQSLTDYYRQQDRDTGKETRLCFYGDHIPSMPTVYKETQYTDDKSDYFIWTSKKTPTNLNKKSNNKIDIEIDSLAIKLLSTSSSIDISILR